MPKLSAEDLQKLLISYLNGEKELKPLPKNKKFTEQDDEKRATYLASIIKKIFDKLKYHEKVEWLSSIEKAFHNIKIEINKNKISQNNDLLFKRLNLLKAHICQINANLDKNWKNALLSYNRQEWQKCKFDEIVTNINATSPLNDLSQFKTRHFASSYTLVGSSFRTNESWILNLQQDPKQQETKTNVLHCLDAIYVSCDFDANLKPSGISMSIADGAGGHTSGAEFAKATSRSAYFANKQSCRLLGAIKNAAEFNKNSSWIIKAIAQEVNLKANSAHHQTGSTLIATKAFIEGKRYCLKGFCIGDSMMAIWNPSKKIITTIAPARVHITDKSKTHATAMFPTQYAEHEIIQFSIDVEPGAVLLCFSDGIHDHLPTVTREIKTKEGDFQEKILDATALQSTLNNLPANATAQQFVELLTNSALSHAEKLRLQSCEQAKMKADDKLSKEPKLREQEIAIRAEKKSNDEAIDEHHIKKPNSTETEKKQFDEEKKSLLDKDADIKKRLIEVQKNISALDNGIDFRMGDDISICALVLPEVKQLVYQEQLSPRQNKPAASQNIENP